MTQEADSHNRKYYAMPELLLGNLLIVIWIILGSISFTVFYPLAAIPFIAIAAFLVFYKLGKKGCVTCYYCKNCTIGMGKLPYLFFGCNKTANVNVKAFKLFPWTFLLLSAVPVALIIVSLLQEVTVFKVGLLVSVLVFSIYSGVMSRKVLFRQKD
ncbi:MAG TPA: hypothetical protein VLH35_06290 [Candidatus Acidoferrales bacterium]|nr:hypothetical protein [Candidatus Acidoferrales bacterium]